MMGYQAAGAAPLVLGGRSPDPETLATAIRIGNPASWEGAVAARDESGGAIDAVTDDEIVAAYQGLAATEGIFCEPASAASLAGLIKANAGRQGSAGQQGRLRPDRTRAQRSRSGDRCRSRDASGRRDHGRTSSASSTGRWPGPPGKRGFNDELQSDGQGAGDDRQPRAGL